MVNNSVEARLLREVLLVILRDEGVCYAYLEDACEVRRGRKF